MISSCVNFTSFEVNGLPSCHLTPFRSFTRYSRPFFWMPPFFAVGISAARLGRNWALSSTRHRLSKRPKWTPRSTSIWGRVGLKTVGSWDSATTIWPPFFGVSAASTAPDRTMGASIAPAPVAASSPSTSRRESDRKPDRGASGRASKSVMAAPFLASAGRGSVRLEEAPRVLHDLVDVLRRILPGIDGDLGLRGEAGHLHRDLVRMSGHVVGGDQQRRLDGAHEIARHREDKVSAVGVHAGEKVVDHGHGEVGALLAQRRSPALDVVLVEQVEHLGPGAAGLHHRGGHHALRSPLDEVVDHGPADAEAHDQELPDAEVVHQPELVVGVGVPGAVDLQGAAGLAWV